MRVLLKQKQENTSFFVVP